jgi:hypothetical protein
VTIAPGERIELQLRRTNADSGVVGGENPDALCPGRELPPAVPPVLLSFGDGHYRCPGGPLAIFEEPAQRRPRAQTRPHRAAEPRLSDGRGDMACGLSSVQSCWFGCLGRQLLAAGPRRNDAG